MTMTERTRSRRRRLALTATLTAALLVLPPTLGVAVPPRPGPCRLVRGDDETIQHFMKRMIRCAVRQWPVRGGATKAICIARRESGLHPNATSATGEYLGLYQHSAEMWPGRYDRWADDAWALDPSALNGRTNTIVTIRMVNADGWGPWRGPGC